PVEFGDVWCAMGVTESVRRDLTQLRRLRRVVPERGHHDAREGVDSFLEKRSPKFTNKVSEDMPPFFPWWEERDLDLG
ncbi:MAG: hypothetical protein QGG73_07360, partial [Candidatus Hydrogenedentes bacterium]|nr:hypothetical protein [Candidatus Hydrogenedentota bacterium]